MSITNRTSDRELWESWRQVRRESKYTCFLDVFTPMGIGRISRIGENALWSVEPSWADRYFFVSSEDIAIQKLVESYREMESKVVEAYVNRLKVILGEVDEHGYVCTHTSTYTIRKGVELICDRYGREVGRLDTYVLLSGGRKIDKSFDYHVWEEKVTEAYQYKLLEALNLR